MARIVILGSSNAVNDATHDYTHFILIGEDISKQKQLEEIQKQLIDELKRSNEQVEQFAYIAAHDLHTPLRMITSYLQLLTRRYEGKLDENADDFINYAMDGAERMSKMIKALLQYSRIGSQGRELLPVDSNNPFNVAMQNLEQQIKEQKAKITVDTLPFVKADEDQLTQLFQNLIANSLKFHSDGSPEIHVSAILKDGFWCFSIKDNGIGIPSEEMERIFLIFQRLENSFKTQGVGIGLSICKRIVERHGGQIWAESVLGEGTTFYFTLRESRIRKNAI